MGQPGIHMLNKTGYSMFWGSMWDNKIMYTRMLKENIFLDRFFSLSFGDNPSINTLSFKDKKFLIYKKKYNSIDIKKSSLYKHIYNINKINYYSSKIWILRYQKWIVLYQFIYIFNFSKNKNKLHNIGENNYHGNYFFLVNYYKKLSSKTKFLFTLKKKLLSVKF